MSGIQAWDDTPSMEEQFGSKGPASMREGDGVQDRNACQSKSHRWSQYDAGVRHCKDCGQIDAYRAMPIEELKPLGEVTDDGVFWYMEAQRNWPPNGTKLYARPAPTAADTGLVERLTAWAGQYEEGSFDTEEMLMREAAAALEAAEQREAAAQETISRMTKALEYADTLLFFDLRKMREFGPDFNQAVVDTGNRVRAALEGSKR